MEHSYRNPKKRRHRADYTDPKPAHITTRYGAWLADLVERFGHEEVASWGTVVPHPYHNRLVRLTCNGAVFYAARQEDGRWRLVADPTYLRRPPRIEGGRFLGVAEDLGEAEPMVRAHAPLRPPAGWTFADWTLRTEAWRRRAADLRLAGAVGDRAGQKLCE